MKERILQTLFGMAIDITYTILLTYVACVGLGIEFTPSLGLAIWAVSCLIRWTFNRTGVFKHEDKDR